VKTFVSSRNKWNTVDKWALTTGGFETSENKNRGLV